MTPAPIHVTRAQAKRLERNLKGRTSSRTKEEQPMIEKISEQDHKVRHIQLHKMLDELLADFIEQTGETPSHTTLMEFLKWSYEQTQSPTEKADS